MPESNKRSDVYSIGCILYESLCGRRPYLGNSNLEVMQMQKTELPRAPEFSWTTARDESRYRNIALKCLQKEPEKRFQNALDLHSSFIATSNDLTPSPSSQLSTWSKPRSVEQKSKFRAIITLVMLSVFFCLLLYLSSRLHLSFITHNESLATPQEQLADFLRPLCPPLSNDLYKGLLSYKIIRASFRRQSRILEILVDAYMTQNEPDRALKLIEESLDWDSVAVGRMDCLRERLSLIDKVTRARKADANEIRLRCKLLDQICAATKPNPKFLRRAWDSTLERIRASAFMQRLWQSNDKSHIATFTKLLSSAHSALLKLPFPTNSIEDSCIEEFCTYSQISGRGFSQQGAELALQHLKLCHDQATMEKQQINVINNLSSSGNLDNAYEKCTSFLVQPGAELPQHRFKLLLLAGDLAVKLHKIPEALKWAQDDRQMLLKNQLEPSAKFRSGISLCLLESELEKLRVHENPSSRLSQQVTDLLAELPEEEFMYSSQRGSAVARAWADDARNHEAFLSAADLCIEAGDFKRAGVILERYLQLMEQFSITKTIDTSLPAQWLKRQELPPPLASLIKKIQTRIL